MSDDGKEQPDDPELEERLRARSRGSATEFRDRLGRAVRRREERSLIVTRPQRLWLLAVGLAAGGLVLLVIAVSQA